MKLLLFILFFFINLSSFANSLPAYYIVIDQSLIQKFTSSPRIEQKILKHEMPFDKEVFMKPVVRGSFITKRLFFAFLIGGFLGGCVARLINNRTMVLMKAFGFLKTCYGFLKKGCITAIMS